MEENKTKIFWKPIGGEEFKELSRDENEIELIKEL